MLMEKGMGHMLTSNKWSYLDSRSSISANQASCGICDAIETDVYSTFTIAQNGSWLSYAAIHDHVMVVSTVEVIIMSRSFASDSMHIFFQRQCNAILLQVRELTLQALIL